MRTYLSCLAACVLLPAALLAAGPTVEVIVGETAPELEQRAADDVAAILKRLYQLGAPRLAAPSGKTPVIFVGSPTTNPQLDFYKAEWPAISEQTHLLKSIKYRDQPALIIGGGSAVATYWGACEYAHHLGIRSMLYTDLDPIAPPPFTLAGFDARLEPGLSIRAWEISYHGPASFTAWSEAEQIVFVRQLSKLKFNRLVIRVRASDPFIPFAAAGIERKEGKFWDKDEFPVNGDTAGRSAFRGAKHFENPDLASATNEKERIAASQKLLHGVIDAGHQCGMAVSLQIHPYDLPAEFNRHKVFADIEMAKKCSQATVREYLHAYPEIDMLMIGYSSVYEALPSFFQDREIWQRPDSLLITPQVFGVHDSMEVARWLRAVPSTKEVVFGTELPPLPGAEPARPMKLADAFSRQIELGSFQEGILPQSAHTIVADSMKALQQNRWGGYLVTSPAGTGNADFSAYLISRNSFGQGLTPEQACERFLTPACGSEVHTRVMKALSGLERATVKIELASNLLNHFDPPKTMKNYERQELPPAWWNDVREEYLASMNEMYRANTRAREGSRSYTLYLARRCEFGFEFVNCMQAIRNAGVAKKEKDKEKQIAELEKAIDSINGACNALAAVARNNSDRGTIAVLNAYVYRPLVKELEKVDAEE
ncbi:hypothetical protein NA78x_006012 [Anatilimnocola sp. NA78]|uniref:hypothetical protein n=1 Tax=Anatilimnocola sp. NA78 TaxID=3415683 RepID=UPI003CE46A78